MGKIILFVLTAVMAQNSLADWKIGDKKLELSRCEKNKPCLISSSCVKSSCEALKAMRNPQKGEVAIGGTNPGSGVCKKLGGGIVIGMDETGSTQAFCRFKDESLISLNGLWHW